ncbi:hypothetical protein [Chryseobacterium carnipullorum]|uniref:hypothetical protein n=1 Tax=Chryseobacterium carnipullorum TaxID=1124835 RepID=UPI000FE201C2|nr:hypothetical protein [Chryseobacterium carnipullorum]
MEVAENGKKEFAFIYKNEVVLRGIATEKNYKNIVYGFYRDLYHPFKLIQKLEELRVAAFCKRMPKITNKDPLDSLPKESFILSYTLILMVFLNSLQVMFLSHGNTILSLQNQEN